MYSDELGKISSANRPVGWCDRHFFLRGAQPESWAYFNTRCSECFNPALVSRTPNDNMEKIVKYAPLMEIDVWRGEKGKKKL